MNYRADFFNANLIAISINFKAFIVYNIGPFEPILRKVALLFLFESPFLYCIHVFPVYSVSHGQCQ